MGRKTTRGSSEVDRTTRLPACEKVQSSVYWPAPIDHRANQLVDLATAEGERLSKAELLAALVAFAPDDGEKIGEIVRRYRKMKAGDVLSQVGSSDVIVLDERRPGRRPQAQ